MDFPLPLKCRLPAGFLPPYQIDAQLFYSGSPFELKARDYAADALNAANVLLSKLRSSAGTLGGQTQQQEQGGMHVTAADMIAVAAMEGVGVAEVGFHAGETVKVVCQSTTGNLNLSPDAAPLPCCPSHAGISSLPLLGDHRQSGSLFPCPHALQLDDTTHQAGKTGHIPDVLILSINVVFIPFQTSPGVWQTVHEVPEDFVHGYAYAIATGSSTILSLHQAR